MEGVIVASVVCLTVLAVAFVGYMALGLWLGSQPAFDVERINLLEHQVTVNTGMVGRLESGQAPIDGMEARIRKLESQMNGVQLKMGKRGG